MLQHLATSLLHDVEENSCSWRPNVFQKTCFFVRDYNCAFQLVTKNIKTVCPCLKLSRKNMKPFCQCLKLSRKNTKTFCPCLKLSRKNMKIVSLCLHNFLRRWVIYLKNELIEFVNIFYVPNKFQ